MLRDDINKALAAALKARNERAVSTLRLINAALKNADVEARGQGRPPLGDAEVLALLQKMIKQRQESVELYKKGGRADLVQQEEEEIAIISGYLPKQMSEAEMMSAISAAINEIGATSIKDMGKVIGVLRAKHAGQMDMAKASALVKARLSG
ncbi:MAG: GatB/YqeY domain-containing protein [Pseudolabrys sp.]|nr:GatB/YqeY domain-containing protein [Pseudolabrys sp.]